MRKTKTHRRSWKRIVAVAAATGIGAATLVVPATVANAQTARPGVECKTLGQVVQAVPLDAVGDSARSARHAAAG